YKEEERAFFGLFVEQKQGWYRSLRSIGVFLPDSYIGSTLTSQFLVDHKLIQRHKKVYERPSVTVTYSSGEKMVYHFPHNSDAVTFLESMKRKYFADYVTKS